MILSPFLTFGLTCAVVSMIVGGIWYGPLFGKTWMRINNIDPKDTKAIKEMQKKAVPLYTMQFLLSFFQGWMIAHSVGAPTQLLGLCAALVLPTLAGTCMWTSERRSDAWTRFLVQAGYQIVVFSIFAYLIEHWILK